MIVTTVVTWAHLMNPLQLSGSGYRPSLTEQSTWLLPSHPPVVVDGGDGGDVGVGGGLVGGREGEDIHVPPPPLLVPVSMYDPAVSCVTVVSIFPVSETSLSLNRPWRVIPAGLQNMKFSHFTILCQPRPPSIYISSTGLVWWVGWNLASQAWLPGFT